MKTHFFPVFLVSLLMVSAIYSAPATTTQSDIFYAISQGRVSKARAWLKAKPDLAVCNAQGQSVLTFSILTRNLSLINLFVKAGVAINVVDNAGKTALDYAVETNNMKLARQLVKCGAKLTSAVNAERLKSALKSRAAKFFVAGWFFTPFLWIGTYCSLSTAADVMLMTA